MTALVVGGDRLGNIPVMLNSKGIYEYIHWSGRKKGMRKKSIPNHIDLVIILYDYIEHNLTEIIKEQSKDKNIPCIFSKRACSDLAKRLDDCKDCYKCNI